MPKQAYFERLKNDFPVYQEASFLDVFHIQIHPLLKGEIVAVWGDLPVAAQAGGHIQTLPFIVAVLFHLTGKCRAGANDAHITLQDIPQLGQLVDAGLADKLAHTGNAGVVLDLEHRAIHLVLVQQIVQFCLCIGAHGAELIELEGLAVAANALLAENRRSGRPMGHPPRLQRL
mgnify:CR=1 FL=1